MSSEPIYLTGTNLAMYLRGDDGPKDHDAVKQPSGQSEAKISGSHMTTLNSADLTTAGDFGANNDQIMDEPHKTDTPGRVTHDTTLANLKAVLDYLLPQNIKDIRAEIQRETIKGAKHASKAKEHLHKAEELLRMDNMPVLEHEKQLEEHLRGAYMHGEKGKACIAEIKKMKTELEAAIWEFLQPAVRLIEMSHIDEAKAKL